jgi:natural product biosynthesis luciferase-like monooxygenase protein
LAQWLRNLEEQPEAIALRCGLVTLTNSALKQRAIAVAQRVRAIAEDEREIAIVVGRDHQLVVAIVAAACSGKRSTVLSPSMWRRDLVAATAGKIVLTERALAAHFPTTPTICVDEWDNAEPVKDGSRFDVVCGHPGSAFVVWSSKETVTQGSLATFVRSLQQHRFPAERVALVADATSREFLSELWGGLGLGALINIMPAVTDSLEALVKTLQSETAAHGKMSLILAPATADALLAGFPDLLTVAQGLILHGTGLDPAHSGAVAGYARENTALVALTASGPAPFLVLPIDASETDPLVARDDFVEDAILVIADKLGNDVAPGSAGEAWLRTASGALATTGAQGWKTPGGRLEIFVSAEWRISHLYEPRRSQLISYWRERLAGITPCIDLPADRPRAPTLSTDHASIIETLSSELAVAVNAFAGRQNSTVSAICLAAFATVLQRYNRDADIVIGTPLARRQSAAPASNGGIFADVFTVRPAVFSSPCFTTLVHRMTAELVGARDHRIPFEHLIDALQPESDAAHGPLCQAFFAYWQAEPNPTQDAATCGGLRPLGRSGVARGDLALNVIRSGTTFIVRLVYSTALFEEATARRIAGHFVTMLNEGVCRPDVDLDSLEILPAAERNLLLAEWAYGKEGVADRQPVHDRISAQVERSPSAPAVVDVERTLTYRELDEAANAVAVRLQSLGVGPATVVGVYMGRSVQTVVALLGILKAGAAYLPLDPEYPIDRLAFMVTDSGAAIVVSTVAMLSAAGALGATVVPVDAVKISGSRPKPVEADWQNLAYLIYTSGSTGRPKGVRVTHGNLATFLTAMDAQLGGDTPGTWLAVTSISFDISVLEIFWTLTRGFRVVVRADQRLQTAPAALPTPPRPAAASERPMEFSLFFFGNATADQDKTAARYRLVFDAAHFADEHGFTAVWTPERHFHAFGGLYPNPSVLSAALAATTRRIGIRAGSVVLPLHDPLRVAEEWALVDNLSGGRVGVSFASGWQPDDFVLAPDRYEGRKQQMLDAIAEVRRLWKGERVRRCNGVGKEIEVSVYPRPVQAELPIWITSARHPETFIMAGEAGAGILTHLIGHTIEELAEKIALYRDAWHRHGWPGRGHVTLMLHTFVGQDVDRVKDLVRQPLKDYIRTSYDLMAGLGAARGVDMRDLPEQEMEGLLERGFERFFANSGLLGTVVDVAATVAKLAEVGVDEAGCLIDFGVDDSDALAALPHLASARELYLRKRGADEAACQGDRTVIDDMRRHAVSHIQCTPTFASMLLAERGSGDQLRQLRRLLVGGEALPPSLAAALAENVGGTVHNMYGPTEATVWATSCDVSPDQAPSIGRPLPGYRAYVVDAALRPVPIGVAGELLLGGKAVADGYHARPELTHERFTPDHLSADGDGRLYHTGDLVRWRASGELEFLGRVDHQVKLRGRRIELGEIEAALGCHEAIKRVVCDVRGDGDARRIVAYSEIAAGHRPPEATELSAILARTLPDYMVPSDFVWLDALPLTPNGKINRQALPDPTVKHDAEEGDVAPLGDLEEQIAAVWRQVLKVEKVGRNDSFFNLGGNSVLIVATRSLLLDRVGDVSLVDLFRYPTLATLAAALAVRDASRSTNDSAASRAAEAAEQRLAARSRRTMVGATGEKT